MRFLIIFVLIVSLYLSGCVGFTDTTTYKYKVVDYKLDGYSNKYIVSYLDNGSIYITKANAVEISPDNNTYLEIQNTFNQFTTLYIPNKD